MDQAQQSKISLKRVSKYRAVRTEVDGIKFSSKKEALRYSGLKLMELGGLISNLELQPTFRLEVNGVLVCTYKGDFRYIANGNVQIVEDVKGMRRGAAYEKFKIKKRLVKAIYGIEIVEV